MAKKFYLKTLWMLIIIAASYLANFGLNIILARFLAAADYGTLTVIKEIILLVSLLFLLGNNFAILKFVPEYLKYKKFDSLKGYLHNNRQQIFIATIIAVIIGFIGIISWHWLMLAWLIAIYAICFYFSEYLRALNKVFLATIFFDLGIPIAWGTIVIVTSTFISHHKLLYILSCYGLGLLLLTIIQSIIAKSSIPKQIKLAKKTTDKKTWRKTSTALMISKFVLTILFGSEIIILKLFGHNSINVGIFAAILAIGSFYWLMFNAVNYVLSPLISPLATDNNQTALQKLLNMSTMALIILTTVLSIILWIFHIIILNHFGPHFDQGTKALAIVMIGFAITTILGLPWYFLGLSGRSHSLIMPAVIVAILGIIATCILVHFFELIGAAIGLALTDIAMALWLSILMRQKLGLKILFWI